MKHDVTTYLHENYFRFDNYGGNGHHFLEVIGAERPRVVHVENGADTLRRIPAASVLGLVTFSFVDRKGDLHRYEEDTTERANPVIGVGGMQRGVLYQHPIADEGVTLVGGRVMYHADDLYHLYDYGPYVTAIPASVADATMKAWNIAIQKRQKGRRATPRVILVRTAVETIVDFTRWRDHSVLLGKFSEERLENIISEELLEPIIRDLQDRTEVIDVTPYAEWLAVVRRVW